MKALLHVPVPYGFEFDKFILDTFQVFNPDFTGLTKKNRVKHVEDEGHGGTSTGEPWTWVTAAGNAIHLWPTRNTRFNNIVAVELDSRRHATLDSENGIGALLQGLEHFSGKRRDEWDVIRFESYIDKPWYLTSK